MIIIGFPCIGKTTLANNKNNKFVDLESSLLDHSWDDWAKCYVSIAVNLHNQGFNVFISSHSEVMDAIEERVFEDIDSSDICLIYPNIGLKDKWTERALKRLGDDPSDKNLRAYKRVKQFFSNDIQGMMDYTLPGNGLKRIEISDIDYNLEDLTNIKWFEGA